MTQRDMQAGIQAHRATRASQRRIGSTPSRIERIPVPYRACNAPALFRGLPQEPRNKKSARIATFLRLGIVAWRQNAIRSPKTQQKWPFSGLEEQRGVRNRKKVAKIPIFLFLNGLNRRNGADSVKNTRNIMASNLKPEKRKAPAMRTPPEKSIWPESLESTLPWRRTARNKHRAQPSAYRRSLLRPVPHGCTEAR